MGHVGHIIVKMNSLIDKDVIKKLYEASMHGVKIELIIRGICGLRPGLEGVSENITVRSIIGRQLEHSRIFYFAGGGDEQVYLSSADWMARNLNDRVELFFPVERAKHITRIKAILETALKDNVGAHILQANGVYRRVSAHGNAPLSSQQAFYERAKKYGGRQPLSMERRLKPLYRKEE
ncbi:MAG TPA: RNA degradosome polyphosphate kinase, partial [Candidatus Avacidaminococcus intestinavium]|nr:RNA degradosome polyphosphate kinase [Candidatus Avacidaminococcus intestinavium]